MNKPLYIDLELELLQGDLSKICDNLNTLIEEYGPGAKIDIEARDVGFYAPRWVAKADLIVTDRHIDIKEVKHNE